MTQSLTIHPQNTGELLFYQTEDGLTRLEAKLVDESIWLSLNQMVELFQRDKSVISRHIANVFEEGELSPHSVVAKFATTATDGKTYQVDYYNLDVIISVGYRVKSHRGTQFRIWATQRLREYIIKGFTMDDERLKKAGGGNYFDELLTRIRDIRSSEKVFWKKVLNIYATSVDYDPDLDTSQRFFKIVQNKMHWAAHGHTAAEIIKARADASKPNMGLTNFSGKKLERADIGIAKNYLNEDEIDTLNHLVSMYLEFAELQAKKRRVMYMQDWLTKLDDFLRISEHEILEHAGKISRKFAIEHANAQFDQYNQNQLIEPSRVEQDFEKSLKELEQVAMRCKKEMEASKA